MQLQKHRPGTAGNRPGWARLGAALGGASSAALLVAVVGTWLAFAASTPFFGSARATQGILNSSAWIVVIAVGTAVALSCGAIDFSIMANIAFCGIVAATVANDNAALGVVAGVLVGALVGVANAFFVVVLRVNAFLGTLAMLGALRGVDLLLGNGNIGVSVDDRVMGELLLGNIMGVPVPFWVAIVVAVLGVVFVSTTEHGRRFLAVGGNASAARLSGISPRRIQVAGYIMSGAAAGVAGILLASYLGAGVPTAGNGQELTVFSAVLIGGTSLWGGRSNVIGAFLAELLLGIMYTGLIFAGYSEQYQKILSGALLVGSIWFVQRANTSGSRRPTLDVLRKFRISGSQ